MMIYVQLGTSSDNALGRSHHRFEICGWFSGRATCPGEAEAIYAAALDSPLAPPRETSAIGRLPGRPTITYTGSPHRIFYRWRMLNGSGRFEQLGQSHLKHGFTALGGSVCAPCDNNNTGDTLDANCSDSYSSV